MLISRSAHLSVNSFLLCLHTHTRTQSTAQTGVFSTPTLRLSLRLLILPSQPRISALSPLYTQVAIIADLTPNSQLACTQRSLLIIYRLPQHPRPTPDQ